MKKLFQITNQGKKDLEAELAELKGRRIAVADKIAEARDFGDLTENAEYELAREEQGLLETRISELEDILQNSEIIKNGNKKTIDLGSTVELKTGRKSVKYTIVSPVEADPMNGKVSNKSPIGQALCGKKVGDNAIIKTIKGNVNYQIVSIA